MARILHSLAAVAKTPPALLPTSKRSCLVLTARWASSTRMRNKGSTSSSHDADGKPLPSVPDATTFFKMSNPELMLDPASTSSWRIVGGVVAFFTVYLTLSAYREGLLNDGQQRAKASVDQLTDELEVQQRLQDGRLLMRDGSIHRPRETNSSVSRISSPRQ